MKIYSLAEAQKMNRKAIGAFPVPGHGEKFGEIVERAKAAYAEFGYHVQRQNWGMTKVGPDYVVLQESGNPYPFIFHVTADEAIACGFVRI